jgi:hypothetical protein
MPLVGNVKQVNWGGKKAAEEQAAQSVPVVGPAAGPTGPTGPMEPPELTVTPPAKKRKAK